jgi:hypothetical protein
MQVDGPKAADRNGSQQIIHPSQGELAGLKILVSLRRAVPRRNLAESGAIKTAHKPGPVPLGHLPGYWGTEGVQLEGG